MQEVGLFINTATPTSGYFVLCFVAIVVLFLSKKKREAVIFSVALFCTTVTIIIIKLVFAVPRPADALLDLSTYAFPSGHAASAMFLAVMLSWLYIKKHSENRVRTAILVALFIVIALFVGYSRVLIAVHTPVQVIAGFVVGAIIPLLCIYFFSKSNALFLLLRKIFPTL